MSSHRVASELTIHVSGADAGISPRIGLVDDANHRIGSTGAPSDICSMGLFFFESRRVAPVSHRLIHRIVHSNL